MATIPVPTALGNAPAPVPVVDHMDLRAALTIAAFFAAEAGEWPVSELEPDHAGACGLYACTARCEEIARRRETNALAVRVRAELARIESHKVKSLSRPATRSPARLRRSSGRRPSAPSTRRRVAPASTQRTVAGPFTTAESRS